MIAFPSSVIHIFLQHILAAFLIRFKMYLQAKAGGLKGGFSACKRLDLHGIMKFMSDGRAHDEQTIKRYTELAERARRTYSYTYTGFHSPSGAALAYRAADEREIRMWGGTEGCERVVIRFGREDDLGYDEEFPIRIIHIEPKSGQFADKLSHRDFLGAILNLGIERDRVGDILIHENTAYVFILDDIADYVRDMLENVKHTAVRCTDVDEIPEEAGPKLIREEISVASLRLDAVIAKLFHLSRTDSKELFDREKVFVNGRVCRNAEYAPKEGDSVSVRGFGKFDNKGELRTTKKGSLVLEVDRYSV